MSEWQPIETAPKDGNSILIYGTDPELEMAFGVGRGGWFKLSAVPVEDEDATHWMPLPAPPKEVA